VEDSDNPGFIAGVKHSSLPCSAPECKAELRSTNSTKLDELKQRVADIVGSITAAIEDLKAPEVQQALATFRDLPLHELLCASDRVVFAALFDTTVQELQRWVHCATPYVNSTYLASSFGYAYNAALEELGKVEYRLSAFRVVIDLLSEGGLEYPELRSSLLYDAASELEHYYAAELAKKQPHKWEELLG
jgi:hypothetical protein